MKYLILVGDGMGDLPMPELDGRTPLEAAKTPTLDSLCQRGELFRTRTIPAGYPPGSDVANLSLLGYRPEEYYTGRAPLEAAAMGVKLDADETAFRCNLVTLSRETKSRVRMIDYSAGHISSDESHQLIEALERTCSTDRFHFKAGVSYRHILVVGGDYPFMDTVPPHDYIEKDVTEPWQRYMAVPEWKELLLKTSTVLENHPLNQKRIQAGKNPANGIWLWGEGKLPAVPSMFDRFGLRGSLISAVDLLKGLGVNIGLNIINVPGATGYIDTNYKGKADAALDCLKTQDYVFVHVEAPDEAGHQGLLQDKIQAIEDFDGKIVAPILRGLEERKETFRIIATMDHYTPLSLRTHTDSPVPTLLYDSREDKKGSGLNFSEKTGDIAGQEEGGTLPNGEALMWKLLQRQA
ncbi:MAG: cofactor-independent phosphoglycerate mutase [Proteobacteria bacterium]|nr:cofactor-independent phosphoglycerate mutase [Pseudomonadota bacterium]MBU1455661.1 cofactor-independent phosphoglycerate mutase [Pseudomonadota bacterium]